MAIKNAIGNDQYFRTDHIESQIKSASVRGGVVTLSTQFVKFILKLGSTMVLARILTPQDFGLFGMVAAVTGLLVMLKDMGLSMATVQRSEINHKQISTLFWVNLTFGIMLMLVTSALAPAIAWFYGEPRLTWVTLALASAFIFSGSTIQHQALLKRQMRFSALAGIELSSVVIGIIAAIIAAFYGARYWALVLQHLTMNITSFVGVWIMCGWRPGLPSKRSGVRSMLFFGANLSGFSLLNYFRRNIDNVLIGRYWGAKELGLYSRSYQLLLLPIQQFITPITSVAIIALSRLKDDRERYNSYYCSAINIIAFIITPITVTLSAMSDEVIILLLGSQWIEASIIFKVLAIAGIGQPLTSTTGWIFISLGQTDRMMRWALISMPFYLFAFLVGLPWGALGVAISYTFCDHLIRIPLLFYTFKHAPINVNNFIDAVWRPVILSIIIYPVISQCRLFFINSKFSNPLIILISCSLIGFIVFTVSILIWPKARKQAVKIFNIVEYLR